MSYETCKVSEMLDTAMVYFLKINLHTCFRCPKGNAAEAVASKLDKKLRDNLKDARNSLFGRYVLFIYHSKISIHA